MRKKLIKNNSYFIVPAKKYDVRDDKRLLIPFIQNQKIGFVDKDSTIIVEPKYEIIYGDFIEDTDLVKVGIRYSYGFPRSSGRIETYDRYKWGLLDSTGNEVFKCNYARISISDDKKLFTLQSYKYGYCVVDMNGNKIVPYDTFSIIDGYTKGYARVKKNGKWGIIDTEGRVVLPVDYDQVWYFHTKNYDSTFVTKEGTDGFRFDLTTGRLK